MSFIKGIDISVVQQAVDFKAVADSGVKFVICRCGVGNNGIDTLYKQNIANAKAAGLKVMAYHFVFPLPTKPNNPTRDPKVQAKLHADAANGELVACDLEWPPTNEWAKWECNAAQIVQWTIDYLEEYEKLTGIRPIVYTYPSFAKSINLPDWFAQKYKLWIASYTNTPNVPKPWTDWVLWQDSGGEKEKLPNGIPVDTNKAKDLSLWDVVEAAPEPPVISNPMETVPVSEPYREPAIEAPQTAPIVPVKDMAPPQTDNTNIFTLILNFVFGLFNKLFKK